MLAQVPADQQLPLLYLTDSILKNEGAVYRRLFLAALPAALIDVYQRNGAIRAKLRSLVKSWMPPPGAFEGVFPVPTLAYVTQQLDAVDRAAVVVAPTLLSVFPTSTGFVGGGGVGPLFVPQPTIAKSASSSASLLSAVAAVAGGSSSSSNAVATAASTPAVLPVQLLEVLQPTLENAMRVQNDSARIACVNLRLLVQVFTAQANAAVARATPVVAAGQLYQRLVAHRQGAALELTDLMPQLVHGWTPPVLPPSTTSLASAAASAAAAASASRKRGHNDISSAPPLGNLGQLRAPGAPVVPQPSMMGLHPARAAAMLDDERRRQTSAHHQAHARVPEPAQRSEPRRQAPTSSSSASRAGEYVHAPLEFEPSFLKALNKAVIFDIYEGMPTQCGECGMRFAQSGAESRKHADWHFEINRRDKQRLERPSARQWYTKPSDWTSNVDTADAPLEEVMLARLFEQSKPAGGDAAADGVSADHADDDNAHGSTAASGARELGVPSDDAQSTCAVCGDKFEEFWSEADDEWMFRGAVYETNPSGEGQRIVHLKCQQARQQ